MPKVQVTSDNAALATRATKAFGFTRRRKIYPYACARQRFFVCPPPDYFRKSSCSTPKLLRLLYNATSSHWSRRYFLSSVNLLMHSPAALNDVSCITDHSRFPCASVRARRTCRREPRHRFYKICASLLLASMALLAQLPTVRLPLHVTIVHHTQTIGDQCCMTR